MAVIDDGDSGEVVTVFGSRPQDVVSQQLDFQPTSNIGGIQIDTVLEEFYEDALEVTEHPVQRGAQITDHSYKRPMELALNCGWSDSSAAQLFNQVGGLLNTVGFNLGSIGGGNSAAGNVGSFTGGAMAASDYVANIYSQLLALQESRQPLSVVSGLRSYDNMLITSLRVRRDEKTRYVLMVNAFFKQIILVDTQSTTVPPQANQANPASTADTVVRGTVQVVQGALSRGSFIP